MSDNTISETQFVANPSLNSFSSIFKSIPPEAKEDILQTYRTKGGSFGKWTKTDRWAMADAFTTVEDKLEYEWIDARASDKKDKLFALRMSLKIIRRSLEDALNDEER